MDGSCYEHFQLLSCSTNNIKREACSSCQRGNQIPLPPCARLSEEAYKKYYNEDDNGCIGCFWHNYLGPKNPGYFPNLKEEIEKENKIRKELSVKVKKLKRKRKKSEDLF